MLTQLLRIYETVKWQLAEIRFQFTTQPSQQAIKNVWLQE